MCGIAGYKAFGKNLPEKEKLESIFTSIQDRGKDAAGIAFVDGRGKLMVYKRDATATSLIEDKYWKKLALPRTMTMHTRASTKGSEKVNTNNHPIYSKSGVAVVHNGVISNDDYLFEHYKHKRDAQVDSEIILRRIEEGWWKDIKNLEELGGSFASAMIDARHPEELILVRHTNPIHMYMDTEKDILYFASLESNIKNAFSSHWRGIFVRSKIEPISMSDDEAILFNSEGVSDLVSLKVNALKEPFKKSEYEWGSYDPEKKSYTVWGGRGNQLKKEDFKNVADFYLNGAFDHDAWQKYIMSKMTIYEKNKLAEHVALLEKQEQMTIDYIKSEGGNTSVGDDIECFSCKKPITDWESKEAWFSIGKEVYCADCLKEMLNTYNVKCPLCYTPLDFDNIKDSFCMVCSSALSENDLEFGDLKDAKDITNH